MLLASLEFLRSASTNLYQTYHTLSQDPKCPNTAFGFTHTPTVLYQLPHHKYLIHIPLPEAPSFTPYQFICDHSHSINDSSIYFFHGAHKTHTSIIFSLIPFTFIQGYNHSISVFNCMLTHK